MKALSSAIVFAASISGAVVGYNLHKYAYPSFSVIAGKNSVIQGVTLTPWQGAAIIVPDGAQALITHNEFSIPDFQIAGYSYVASPGCDGAHRFFDVKPGCHAVAAERLDSVEKTK